jgi:stage III sporulation protein AB
MLRQIIGGGLVMGTATFLGWTLAGRLTRRPVQLRGLQTAIAVLQSEIEWGQTPLPAALRSAATAAGSKVEALLREAALLMEGGAIAEAPAAAADGPSATSPIAASPACSPKEALRQAITRHGPGTSLTADDLAILAALAPILGATGRHDQSRHLALAKERLSGAEAMARADLERYERLARWGPVLVGAAIVLILS